MNRQLPHSLEAEQAVIGSMIIDPNQITLIKELLQPHFFYDKTNELIFEALVSIKEKNKVVDFLTIKEELSDSKVLDLVGGMDFILDLTEDISIAINVMEYAKIVYEKFVARETIKRASNILAKGYELTNVNELLEYAEKEIFDLSKMTRSDSFLDWEELIDEAHKRIRELVASPKNELTGLATGFSNLDKATNGLQKSDLIILAARPSVGKTAYALNLAKNVAASTKNKDANVAIFSLEMSAEQLTLRLLSAESNIPHHAIRNATISNQEWVSVTNTAAKLAEYKFFIDDLHLFKSVAVYGFNDLDKFLELINKNRKKKIEE